MRSRPPPAPSLSLTVAMTSPVGGSQAHPSCSHGTLGSEAVGDLALVPRSSSRSDLPAGQQEALRPERGSGERGGSCGYTPGPAGGRAWRGLSGADGQSSRHPGWATLAQGTGQGPPWGDARHSSGVSPHSPELPAPTGAAVTETPGAAQAHQSSARSAALMWSAPRSEQEGASRPRSTLTLLKAFFILRVALPHSVLLLVLREPLKVFAGYRGNLPQDNNGHCNKPTANIVLNVKR